MIVTEAAPWVRARCPQCGYAISSRTLKALEEGKAEHERYHQHLQTTDPSATLSDT